MSTSEHEFVEVEELLAEAGMAFTVVDRCPDPACRICTEDPLPAAA